VTGKQRLRPLRGRWEILVQPELSVDKLSRPPPAFSDAFGMDAGLKNRLWLEQLIDDAYELSNSSFGVVRTDRNGGRAINGS
jgi:hypothetical protein